MGWVFEVGRHCTYSSTKVIILGDNLKRADTFGCESKEFKCGNDICRGRSLGFHFTSNFEKNCKYSKGIKESYGCRNTT